MRVVLIALGGLAVAALVWWRLGPPAGVVALLVLCISPLVMPTRGSSAETASLRDEGTGGWRE